MCRDLANLLSADDEDDDDGGNHNGQLLNANDIGPIWQNGKNAQDFDEDANDNGL